MGGVLATARQLTGGRKVRPSPGTAAFVARIPTSPHTRGEVIGCAVDSFASAQAVAIQCTAFGDEILACPVC
jgi:hypothetical protein